MHGLLHAPIRSGLSLTLVFMISSLALGQGKKVDFGRDIRPILAKHCFACHGPDTQESGLRLTDFANATGVADSGEVAIEPGNRESSLLRRVRSQDGDRMPPEGKALTAREVALLEAWIESGGEYTEHWAFQPIRSQRLPEVGEGAWCETPIDRFLMAGLESSGLRPAAEANSRQLIRRLSFNLLGVPPKPEEVEAFAADASPESYRRLVDGMMEDPRFGEHWARHWLDVVRYAETNSFERDGAKPNAWRYRDYVIQSFNEDKPYDRFLREQLAGDELPDVSEASLIATGYYRLGIWDDEPADPLQAEFDGFDDIVTTTGQAMLGLTVNCARCHDHKIDPISQKDYYQLVAFFRDIKPYGDRGGAVGNSQIEVTPPELRREYHRWGEMLRKLGEQAKEIEQRGIVKMPAPDQRATEGGERERVLKAKLREHLSAEDYETWLMKRQAMGLAKRFLEDLPERKSIMGLAKSLAEPPPTQVLMRGSPHAPGDEVGPGFPSLFASATPAIGVAEKGAKSAGRRRVLADWMVSEENFLTARVIVNRIWQHHFGRGLVRSPNNFGQGGDPPSHPELLDWLASELIRHEWQMKPIHRMILLSRAYRMGSQSSDVMAEVAARASEVDPENLLLWRFPMRRLSAEEIRDNTLAVTGYLEGSLYGPSIYPYVADEVKATQSEPGKGWKDSSESERSRRSIYIHIKRSLIPPELAAFDFPETDTTCEARFLTTQPAQSLNLLNGAFMQNQSRALAVRLERECGDDLEKQLARGIQLAWGHPAERHDVEVAARLIETLRAKHGIDGHEALGYACLAMLNANACLYLD